MTAAGRLLEPALELDLLDRDHVLVRVKPAAAPSRPALLELVLDDAQIELIARRMEGLRIAEREAARAAREKSAGAG